MRRLQRFGVVGLCTSWAVYQLSWMWPWWFALLPAYPMLSTTLRPEPNDTVRSSQQVPRRRPKMTNPKIAGVNCGALPTGFGAPIGCNPRIQGTQLEHMPRSWAVFAYMFGMGETASKLDMYGDKNYFIFREIFGSDLTSL